MYVGPSGRDHSGASVFLLRLQSIPFLLHVGCCAGAYKVWELTELPIQKQAQSPKENSPGNNRCGRALNRRRRHLFL